MSPTLEQLKTELALKQEARKAEINETIAIRKIELEMRKLSSPAFLEREIVKADNVTLAAIISSFEDLETGKDKAIKPVYGYGAQVDKLLTILRSTQFAKREFRESMEAIISIDADLIEETMDALGSPAYYSMANDVVMEEVQPDLETLKNNLNIICVELNITKLNIGKLTDRTISNMYASARTKAQTMLENTRKYNEENEPGESTTYDT